MTKRIPGRLLGRRSYLNKYIDGRDWIHVWVDKDDPLRYVEARTGRILTPPDRFTHDFASIPRLFWRLIGPPAGAGPGKAYGPAAIIHDWAYESQRWGNGSVLSRLDADVIFQECLYQLDVDEWRVRLMYLAVRVGGAGHYRRHTQQLNEGSGG